MAKGRLEAVPALDLKAVFRHGLDFTDRELLVLRDALADHITRGAETGCRPAEELVAVYARVVVLVARAK